LTNARLRRRETMPGTRRRSAALGESCPVTPGDRLSIRRMGLEEVP
jgi:hypothetical protein